MRKTILALLLVFQLCLVWSQSAISQDQAGAASHDPSAQASPPESGVLTATDDSVALFPIRSVDIELNDEVRKKRLGVRVTAPDPVAARSPLPWIIFSHGAGGSQKSYRYLMDYWASRGFVCVQPTHDDSLTLRKGPKLLNFLSILKALPKDYKGWLNRSKDVDLVLNQSRQISEAAGVKLDPSAVGMGGHSYGAFSSMLAGGAAVPEAASSVLTNAKEPRVKAILLLSPPAVRNKSSDFGFDGEKSFESISIPAMFMTGVLDKTGSTVPNDRKKPFELAERGDKYFVLFDRTTHMTFSGRTIDPKTALQLDRFLSGDSGQREKREREPAVQAALKPESAAEVEKSICVISTAFWNAYLRGDKNARSFLEPSSLTKQPAVSVAETR